jgi:hypothetical protein
MDLTPGYRRNQEAYRRLKAEIGRDYPLGRFVAIHDGRIAADAADLEELDALLKAAGVAPRESLVVQAGVDYPEYVVILTPWGMR